MLGRVGGHRWPGYAQDATCRFGEEYIGRADSFSIEEAKDVSWQDRLSLLFLGYKVGHTDFLNISEMILSLLGNSEN